MSDTKAHLELDTKRFQISEDFLTRYNRPGPRYTSYPTAPVWNDQFGPGDLEQVCAESDHSRAPVSLYFHLPFCESLCLFCACNVVIQKDKHVAQPYLDFLKAEIEQFSERVSRTRSVVQYHWGGGTPTYLSPGQMEDLFNFTHERFSFSTQAEVGVEVDPRVTTRAHLETLSRLGFNRLSMGIQDFHPEVQAAIHRIQPLELTRDLILTARTLGFDSINVDLIYGLPYQTSERFARTVEQVLQLQPNRVALFSYAHVPWLHKQQGSFAGHLPEGIAKFDIFRTGLQQFLNAGYLYIGMDHFARQNDELAEAQRNRTLHRNFQGYTTKAGADLYGMGVSAISSIGDGYAQNFRDLQSYQSAVTSRGLATMRGYRLSHDDIIRRSVINRLLCHTIIPKRDIEREFSIDFDEYFSAEMVRLQDFCDNGLITISADEICATMLGRIFIRNVAMVFDAYLEKQQLEAKPLFSKTI